MSESYQKSVEKMQSLGESMEEINKLRQNPELVCDRTELMALNQRTKELCNEVDSCRKDFDEIKTLIFDDRAQLEDKKKECESKVTKAEDEIVGLKNSIPDREIRECEQQILEVKKNQSEMTEEHSRALNAYLFFPLLMEVSAVTNVICAENQIQRLHEKKDLYQNKKIYENLLIESKLKDIKINKYEYQECRQMAAVMTSFKRVLLHWLQFLKDLTLKMNRLENVFNGALAVRDTVVYREYVGFINGFATNKSLKFAKNMRQIASMDPLDIILSLQSDG